MNDGCLCLLLALSAATAFAGALPKVRLGGVLGERFETSITGNVLKVDLEKDFFPPFLTRQAKAGTFIGLGKHADALVHYARNCDDPRVLSLKKKVIGFLIDHQDPDGYTGCVRPEDRLGRVWDLHEMGFIIQALLSDYELFGNERALAAARRNVDYVLARWDGLPAAWKRENLWDRLIAIGFGFGVARLHEATRDARYLDFLCGPFGLADWKGTFAFGRRTQVRGHMYAHLSTCLEQLELYRLKPQERYLLPSLKALELQTKGDGLLVDGNGGVCECWTADQDGEGHVGETCAAAYGLFFWDALFRLKAVDRVLLGDLMERNVHNALFAAMSRDGRRLRYYTPLNGERRFWDGDLYCCPNNFRRAMSRLPEYLFHVDGDEILANLYSACTAELEVAGSSVRIVEKTDYPNDGRVTFSVEPEEPVRFAFSVRLPRWCREPSVRLNGVPADGAAPGRFLSLSRVWRKGDTVELSLPMTPRAVLGRRRQSGRFAVLLGPVVYALDTRSVPKLRDVSPLEAQTVFTLDPRRLRVTGKNRISAIACISDAETAVELVPFPSETANLTYFRAPDITDGCLQEDSLFTQAP